MRKNNKPYTIEYVNEQFNKKDYTLLSKEYKNTNTKLNFVCNKHVDLGVQQVTFASFSTNKCNCSGCKHEAQIINWHNGRNFKPISQDEFYNKNFNKYKEKLFNAVGNEYVLLDVSKKNNHVYMILKHTVCNTVFDIEVNHFFSRNQRCKNKQCISEKKSAACMKSLSKLKEEIFNLVGDEYEIIGDYTGTNNNAVFYHKMCGNTFEKTPHNFLQGGQRCPHCVLPTKGEQKIIDYLKLHNEKYTFQKTYGDLKGINNGLLSYDIYLNDKNILIEYQGQFHDGTAYKMDDYKFYRQQEHDKRKRQYAEDNHIKLLEIWYWDFDNIEQILDKELTTNIA